MVESVLVATPGSVHSTFIELSIPLDFYYSGAINRLKSRGLGLGLVLRLRSGLGLDLGLGLMSCSNLDAADLFFHGAPSKRQLGVRG